MDGFVTDNAVADEDTRKRGGWFIGHFMAAEDLRKSGDVEVKWGIHRAGEKNKGGFVANSTAKSMSIVISGHFRVHFRDRNNPEAIRTLELAQTGRYAMWDKGVEHDWEAITDCTVLTVRWPSAPKDQP